MIDENKPQPNIETNNIKTLRTYSSDMADVVRENEISVIKIAVAEQKKHEREDLYRKARGTSISKFFLLIGALLLIAGGIIGSYYLLKKKDIASAPEQIQKGIETFISYDEQAFVDMTNATSSSDVINILKEEMDKKSTQGSIKSLFQTTSVSGTPALLSLQKFFSLMKISAPGPLTRSLADQYLVGTYMPNENDSRPHLFLMFETNDFNVAYVGMLEWEKTILDDLFGLFHIDVSGDRSELFEKPWKDIIINNRDARILYDDAGANVLYYTFLDKNKIIITDSGEVIKEIITRLLTQNTKPL